MYSVNPLEYSTIRIGRLVSVPVEIKDKHPKYWDWYIGTFGLGWRIFSVFDDESGLFHEIRIDYKHLMGVCDKKNPRKINVQFIPNHFKNEKKGGLRLIFVNHSVFLKNINKLFFEDYETKKRFEIRYSNVMDYFQPPMENVEAFWRFNPYAVFGTGFNDWCDPYTVNIIIDGICLESDERYGIESHQDWQMYRCIQPNNKKGHLKDLTEYTGINFVK